MKGRSPPVDYEELALYLRTLGVPNRLELLRRLQVPHAVGDIRLAPARRSRDRDPDRPLSRNAIEQHLARLEELGLVHARSLDRDGRATVEYVTNAARLFVVIDEMRRVSLMRAQPDARTAAPDEDEGAVAPPDVPKGPALVLVNGPLEGAVFPLEGKGPWTIGRERGLSVALPHDPFVSKENTVLRAEGARFLAEDAPGSRNGTRVNWAPLATGERRALVGGDVLGVGRSLLVWREGR